MHKEPNDRAIEDFNQAIRLNPNYAAAFHNRGLAYDDKGQYDRAIEDFNQAIRLDPNDAIAFYNRGISWERKNDLQRALADFRRFAELAPSDPDGPKAIQRVTKALSGRSRISIRRRPIDCLRRQMTRCRLLLACEPVGRISEA